MAEADAGEGGGAGGGTAGSENSGTVAGNSQSQAGAGGTGDAQGNGAAQSASVLANAGGEGQQSQAVAIPEKYQVKKEDGTVDIEASSLKLAEAYGHLEKRLGSGDAPPKTPEEYQIIVPDALKDALDPKTDPLLGAFLKDAHAAGLSQKQVDLVMGKYFDLAPKLIEGSRQLSEAECIADLKNEWKDDATFKAEVGKAYKAVQAYGDKDAQAILAEYGNDPRVIRLMARVGAELGEDRSINPGGTLPGGQSVESLMQSEAYTNPKHADHARVSAQVQGYFNKQAEAQAKAGNVPIL
jgi:hypothetical protein